ncbi:hypothetical protein SAMN03080617_02611 [Algoriphagus alkaliphilus]|uniref:Uncharacterized protein n=1 Tax=Algoriphagus alkaliphilus TaxID=279824 RepID=A0A1G5YJR9_9BACT|nr:hypothetical protein [Cyclobacterium sp.]SDA83058.1 hypothetical protein SAMN03080617_02611 [Algoriphagus alkaliphilus]
MQDAEARGKNGDKAQLKHPLPWTVDSRPLTKNKYQVARRKFQDTRTKNEIPTEHPAAVDRGQSTVD